MVKSPKNTLLIVSLVCFVAGWVLVSNSDSLVHRFLTRKAARITLTVKPENYGLMSDLLKDFAGKESLNIRLKPFASPDETVWTDFVVNARAESESIATLNQLVEQLRAEFARRSSEAPNTVGQAEMVPIVTPFHQGLSTKGFFGGIILLVFSLVSVILHFLRSKKETPPPLPGQPADPVTFDY